MEAHRWDAVKNYWVNDGPKAVFLTLFLLANCVVFLQSFFEYMDSKYFVVLSYGVCIAKASAATIKLNCACILIPVLRNFLSWVRGTWVNTYIPVDKNIIFHKFVAWLIAIGVAAHTVAHYWNFLILSTTDSGLLKTIGFETVPSQDYLYFYSIPGATGHVALLIMVLMYSSAVETVRKPMFEAFWYTHHLFILFLVLVAFHGFAGLFGPPSFWYWVVGPTCLYLVERTLRFARGKQTTMLLLAVQHPSRVIELRMKKQSFVYKPGQYLYLNCPCIAKNEWHPFTITSAPDEEYVSVHINTVGNWTTQLASLFNPDKKLGVVQQDLLEGPDGTKILAIDGPFGAASEEVFKFKRVMLVGAGIGVTPFASILKHIKYQIKKQRQLVEKVYFYWLCRDKNSFEWFSSMIADMETENVNNFLEIKTYLTGALSIEEVQAVFNGKDEESLRDSVTGLTSPTQFGRPNWGDIFPDIARRHIGSDVGVFFCGPRVLSKQLYYNCRKFTNTECRFHYHKENF